MKKCSARKSPGPIRVGIWGLGRAGHNMHASELAKFPELFQVTAVCDRLPERVKDLQDRFHCAGYTDGDEFLKDPSTELVSVVIRSPAHVDAVYQVLDSGKTVFLEKPVALTAKGLARLEKADKLYPGKLFVRHNRRFEACFNHIRDIMASGILGEIFEIKLRRHRYQSREDWQTILDEGGGQINNWGPHLIDHSLILLDSPVKDLWSDFKCVASRADAEDHIKVIFRGENGRIVDLEISDGVLLPSDVYEIYGTRGSLRSRDEQDIQLKYLDPSFKIPPKKSSPGTPPWNGGYGEAQKWPWRRETIMTKPANGYDMTDIYKYLYQAIREGKPFPVRNEQAFAVVRTTLALKKQNPAFQPKKLKDC